MYTIEVNYRTGNSFNTEVVTDSINLVWESKELARKALKSLSEHYKLVEEQGYYDSEPLTIDMLKQYDWFKPEEWPEYGRESECSILSYWKYYCHVELDDGSYRTLNVSTWTGHFESLYSAKIVLVDGEDEDEVHF